MMLTGKNVELKVIVNVSLQDEDDPKGLDRGVIEQSAFCAVSAALEQVEQAGFVHPHDDRVAVELHSVTVTRIMEGR
jgi:hypothetical protein